MVRKIQKTFLELKYLEQWKEVQSALLQEIKIHTGNIQNVKKSPAQTRRQNVTVLPFIFHNLTRPVQQKFMVSCYFNTLQTVRKISVFF